MEIPYYLDGKMYDNVTIEAWQEVWDRVCRMAYEKRDICESIVTKPGIMHINGRIIHDKRESTHVREYCRLEPINHYFLTLENIWKQYSQLYSPNDPDVILEFKELIVPRCLYECLGVSQWFKYSFPNCKVSFWDE